MKQKIVNFGIVESSKKFEEWEYLTECKISELISKKLDIKENDIVRFIYDNCNNTECCRFRHKELRCNYCPGNDNELIYKVFAVRVIEVSSTLHVDVLLPKNLIKNLFHQKHCYPEKLIIEKLY
jgi:hypothetical protein